MGLQSKISIRLADARDIPELRRLIEASVLGLQASDYSPAQLKRALEAVYGVDTQLIADRTYFVAEAPNNLEENSNEEKHEPESSRLLIVGCGGLGGREHFFGGGEVRGA